MELTGRREIWCRGNLVADLSPSDHTTACYAKPIHSSAIPQDGFRRGGYRPVLSFVRAGRPPSEGAQPPHPPGFSPPPVRRVPTTASPWVSSAPARRDGACCITS